MSIGSFKNVEIICIRASGLLCKRPVNRPGRSEGQQSVGNIVIVVGETATRIVDAPKRKARSDQAEQLYCYDRPIPYGGGDTMLHRIYPYDMRYVSRHKRKLDNK